ncbi:MAG: zf-HC2 domain-containing protein [Candidatus Sumerlaeia bacterium]|nr:zf-HC2 domain-containing protein [Candidatus Sumerlaeia bacterium]
MNCNTAKKLVDEYLSLSLSPELTTQLEEHLYLCPDCRQLVEEWDTLREAIRAEYQLIHNSVSEVRLTTIFNAVQSQLERQEKGSIREWIKVLLSKLWVSPALSWQLVRASTVLIIGVFIGMVLLRSPKEKVTMPLEKTSVPSVSSAEKKIELAEAPISSPRDLSQPQPTPEIINKLPAVQVTPMEIIKSPLEKANIPVEKEFSIGKVSIDYRL